MNIPISSGKVKGRAVITLDAEETTLVVTHYYLENGPDSLRDRLAVVKQLVTSASTVYRGMAGLPIIILKDADLSA